MVNCIFIIHESGLCLVSRDYTGNSAKVNLFSGLLSAISSFSRVMIGEDVNEIRMEHHRILYDTYDTILVALITSDSRLSKRKLTYSMRKIAQAFLEIYKEHLEREILEPQLYEGFSATIDEIGFTSGIVKNFKSQEDEKPPITSVM